MEIKKDKLQEIENHLQNLEREKGITILHAVESGSRAWGFPSLDSDYDVRIIYHHEHEWYISPFEKKDNIEIPITDDLDIAGWDIGKTLSLLYKGNATVHEWLNSPIVYFSNQEKHSLLRDFAAKEFNAAPAFYHYISLTKRKFLEPQTQFNAKAYLYGLRALLCANWIADRNTAPPVLFEVLTKTYLDTNLKNELKIVLQDKAKQKEKDAFAIPKNLWQYSLETYEQVSESFSERKRQGKQSDYEQLLRKIVM
ncbi:nucleotidyltransferase domain-containing protein [Teredinibacter sp. KSP-S5-2]|uniref:nucleotidyltransferase domain-containing protein n=1 Tax=Teredinibacter sp. KSP-S5-2 TaxID=3034506 RepID=UPI0029351C10|nr:nucleotidyltransferase domain-containing protein [Teredinibacter sp. KSP-S5-2]WNO10845.1 nucleotidyltransferase domain-containing protein [Teredinibacter sp. KSP-S5-2]